MRVRDDVWMLVAAARTTSARVINFSRIFQVDMIRPRRSRCPRVARFIKSVTAATVH
jgi:hypothetical protein